MAPHSMSHNNELPKKLAVHRVLYASILLSRRKKWGRKRCTTTRENRSLERLVKQNRFKNFGELHKERTEAGVEASRATTHRRVRGDPDRSAPSAARRAG